MITILPTMLYASQLVFEVMEKLILQIQTK